MAGNPEKKRKSEEASHGERYEAFEGGKPKKGATLQDIRRSLLDTQPFGVDTFGMEEYEKRKTGWTSKNEDADSQDEHSSEIEVAVNETMENHHNQDLESDVAMLLAHLDADIPEADALGDKAQVAEESDYGDIRSNISDAEEFGLAGLKSFESEGAIRKLNSEEDGHAITSRNNDDDSSIQDLVIDEADINIINNLPLTEPSFMEQAWQTHLVSTFTTSEKAKGVTQLAKVHTLYRNVALWYAYKLGPSTYKKGFQRKRQPLKKPQNPNKQTDYETLAFRKEDEEEQGLLKQMTGKTLTKSTLTKENTGRLQALQYDNYRKYRNLSITAFKALQQSLGSQWRKPVATDIEAAISRFWFYKMEEARKRMEWDWYANFQSKYKELPFGDEEQDSDEEV